MIKVKRSLALVLVLVLFISLVLTGCSGQKPASPAPAPAPAPAKSPFEGVNLKITTSPAGGGWFPFAGAIATTWQKYIPGLTATAQTSGGVFENIELLRTKRAEVGFFNPDLVYQNFHKMESFKDKDPYNDIRVLFNIMGAPMHVMVMQKSGIKSIADWKGKRVGVGPTPLSAINAYVKVLLEAYGIDEKDIKTLPYDRQARAEALADGQIDVFIEQITPGAPLIVDLISKGAVFLDLTPEAKKKIMEKYPYYSDIDVKKEFYKLDRDYTAVGIASFIGVDAGMDEKLAYELTKVFYERLDEIGAAYAPAKDIKISEAYIVPFVKIHPGSERYLKEKGALK